MVLQTGNNKLERTIWPQHVLSLVPPISGQVTGTCDEECRMGVGGSGGGGAAFQSQEAGVRHI